MNRRVLFEISGPGPWTVATADLPPRELAEAATELGVLPVPPDGAMQTNDLVAALDRLERNDVDSADGSTIGQHLLSCLVDAAGRQALLDGDDDINLVVATSKDAAALQRLPWELLHDGDGFLALRRRPAVAISRSVGPAARVNPGPVALIPRVLVVIGTTLDDPTIQPAAEYLALLDTVRRRHMGLEANVIVNANRDDLAAACRTVQPDIIHLIAHGEQLANGSSYVELAPLPRSDARSDKMSGEQLINVLSAGAALPRVLVLTACRTAAGHSLPGGGDGPDFVTFRPSLAADCVQLGVPIVAAMTGTIASQTCREFTFAFYGALLASGNVLQAAAAGRREAYIASNGVTDDVDWAYPAVFSTPDVDGRVELDASGVHRRRVARAAELLSDYRRPPTFCGRHEVLDAFGRFLTATTVGAPVVLALCSPSDVSSSTKVGTSRTLAELAAIATLAGYCVSDTGQRAGDDRGQDFLTLARRLAMNARDAARVAGAEPPTTLQVMMLDAQPAPELDPAIRERIEAGTDAWNSTEVVGMALRSDLAVIGRAVGDGPSPGRGLVIQIDDLHKYGLAVSGLLRTVTGNGLGTSEQRVPLLFSYSAGDGTPGDGAIEAIASFVQRGRAVKCDLKPFAPPTAHLAYQQLLLGGDEPLVAVPKYRDKVLDRIQQTTNGNPTMFIGDALQVAILAFRDTEALVPATDLQRLSELIGEVP
ncbi:CHAT domain-containing protein [Agromyces sp. ZXT2-6]|uniref:CHAT domain-containing protein n=1 Tax=Agromyces sp. ZXT2-6 TaxID=3461153 RepID=UPI0040550D69